MPTGSPRQPPADQRRRRRHGRRHTARRGPPARPRTAGSPSRAAAAGAAPAPRTPRESRAVSPQAPRPGKRAHRNQRHQGQRHQGQRHQGHCHQGHCHQGHCRCEAGVRPDPEPAAIAAAITRIAAATPNAPRADATTITASPPRGLAATCATWEAIRISDRAGTYADGGFTARSHQRAPGAAASRPFGEARREDQRQQGAHRHPRQCHHGDQRGGQQVPAHQQAARRHPVHQPGQQRAGHQVGQEAECERQRRQRR